MSGYESDEEKYFSWYLDELFDGKYVEVYILHPDNYILSDKVVYEHNKQLKTKTKILAKMLVDKHIYTADFLIKWAEHSRCIFFNSFSDRVNAKKIPFVADENRVSIVEIKADFSKFGMIREFSINQKWMFQKYGIYVNKIIVSNKNGLFKNTFTPEKFLLTDKSRKGRKLHYNPRSLKEFLTSKELER